MNHPFFFYREQLLEIHRNKLPNGQKYVWGFRSMVQKWCNPAFFLFLNMRYWYCRACESACKSVSHAQTLALFHATSDRFIICWRAAIQLLRTAYNPLYPIITSCFVTWRCCLQNPKLILNSLHFLKFHTQILRQWIQADTIKLWHQRNLPFFFSVAIWIGWITLREMWAGYT